MSNTESSANPAHPPPTTETRTCPSCEGEGYVPLSHDYNPTTGRLLIVGGLCVRCRGEGELVVYLYSGGRG